MPVNITHNNYGKSCVRVLKVTKKSDVHIVREMTVNIQLEGDFDKVHTEGDNRKVLPTDTMKNTVYALAKDHPVNSIEEFGIHLAEYLLKNNEQITEVDIEIEEKLWKRIMVENENLKPEEHKHSFVSAGDEKRICQVSLDKEILFVSSGVKDLLVLKTTESGFENYIKDKFTILKETSDRVFSTSIKAEWDYISEDINYNSVYEEVRKIILETFATHHSLSVQHTLYETGKNILHHCKEISEISISMPNKHYLPFNLEQFGMENNNGIFIPTDEPYGLIEATLSRDSDIL